MIIQHRRLARRTGAALVETAAVVAVFCMILFGVVEFCRFFFMRQLIDNAAREGARYAVVHTADATVDADTRAAISYRMQGFDQKVRNFTIQIYHADSAGNRVTAFDPSNSTPIATQSDAGGTYVQDSSGTKTYTKSDVGGTYLLDSGGAKVYVNVDTKTNTVTGVNSSTFNTFVTNQKIQGVDPVGNAAFGQYIAVEITCDYDPITPTLLRLNQTVQIHVKSLMYSEAN